MKSKRVLKFILITGILFQIFWYGSYATNVEPNKLFDNYDVKFYFINIKVSNLNTDIFGTTEILLQFTSPHPDSIAVELTLNAVIDSIVDNNLRLAYTRRADTVIISIPEGINKGDLFNLRIFYNIVGVQPNSDQGIYSNSVPGNKSLTWTITEPYFAKNWFPCKQDLKDKADSAYIFITAPDSVNAGSNGLLTKIVPLPDHKKRYEWKTLYPIDFYLISFSLGNYLNYQFYASTADGDSVLVQNFIYNDSAFFRANKKDIDKASGLITLFSEKFGPYPFKKEKYGHCLAPVGGGMENQTMTTLNTFDFELVAHEMAHQWFGDHVTCNNWQNIWLNEGFASYAELVALEKFGSETEIKDWISWASTNAKIAKTGSVFVPADNLEDVHRIFDNSLTYLKGAFILHMIRHEINNDDLFYGILKSYQSQFAFSVASTEDFRKVIEDKSGINFENFFNQWIYGEGYPVLNLAWEQTNDSLIIDITQTVTAPAVTPFFEHILDLRLDYFGGDTIVKFKLTQPIQRFIIPFKLNTYRVVIDPDNWLLKEIKGVSRVFSKGKSSNFIVFPNPANSDLYIENLDYGKPYVIKIYDINGLLIMQSDGYEVFTKLNIEQFEPGVYQLIISSDNLKETFKLVKT